MKFFFLGTLGLLGMLVVISGCDQEMNMMKPVVQDVMDAQQEDEPDTTMPPSQPITEVEQDEEMVEPNVPEPDVEAPPVSTEDPPVEPPDMVEEIMEEADDPYTSLGSLTVSSGRVQFLFFSAGGCISIDSTINGVRYTTHYSKWQRRDNAESSWEDIPGTRQDGGLCPYIPADPGQYRLVCEISINGVRGKYRSTNTLTVE